VFAVAGGTWGGKRGNPRKRALLPPGSKGRAPSSSSPSLRSEGEEGVWDSTLIRGAGGGKRGEKIFLHLPNSFAPQKGKKVTEAIS